MELYASMRLMLVWVSAAKLPTTMLSSADAQMNGSQRAEMESNAVKKTRTNTAKATALGPTDMNSVTGAAAPWYTSGAQIWNGAAATLKANPTNIRAAAVPIRSPLSLFAARKWLIRVRLVEPVAP